jgi:single-strand DNA-binding protein
MNKAIIIGNLTKDPELKTTASGISVCTFRVAVTRPYKRDETDFLSIVTWRGLAENCAKFLAKGRKVGIVGSIQTREYDDNNGQRRYVTEIVADDVEFLTPKGEGGARSQDVPPPPDDAGLFGDEPDDFEPLDDEQMPF